ncbi:hypothetical protein J2N86_10455 [Legionella lytica]|uniref:Uncharacterized protein n=1 Tax=Legionella lytica TaxID=96232 RepID=A0ABY4Y6J8_9GAMM|nr:hypothetical protein [Legionella lytica]USQ13111.1 hypothetical protein J2N86_10455 [Legionella lytica]
MKKIILVLAMVVASVALSNCCGNPCNGVCAPSDCSGTNSYTGNWY